MLKAKLIILKEYEIWLLFFYAGLWRIVKRIRKMFTLNTNDKVAFLLHLEIFFVLSFKQTTLI